MNSFIFFSVVCFPLIFLLLLLSSPYFKRWNLYSLLLLLFLSRYRIHMRCEIYCIGTWASWIQAFVFRCTRYFNFQWSFMVYGEVFVNWTEYVSLVMHMLIGCACYLFMLGWNFVHYMYTFYLIHVILFRIV